MKKHANKEVVYKGKSYDSLRDLADELELDFEALMSRIYSGQSYEEAIKRSLIARNRKRLKDEARSQLAY